MRTISDLGYAVADGVLHAIRLLTTRYGATLHDDSGHTESSPTWIYKSDRYDGAEIGVRMNKQSVSLYMRDNTLSGRRLRDTVPPFKVAKVYPGGGNPASSILQSEYLKPASHNEILLLSLDQEDVESVLAAFFAKPVETESEQNVDEEPSSGNSGKSRRGRPICAEDFAVLMERQSVTGRTGEETVVQDEIERLRRLGCSEPERFVKRIAEVDVGRGFDIESTWPGEERCIEVKTTSQSGGDFFLTANEREVLAALGAKAWLYRVSIDSAGKGVVETRLNDPMRVISDDDLSPVVWRVAGAALKSA
jgi:hypothetical protein